MEDNQGWLESKDKVSEGKKEVDDVDQDIGENSSDVKEFEQFLDDLIVEHKVVLKACYDIIKSGNKPCVSVGRLSEVAGISEDSALWHLKMMEADSLGVFFDDGCESFCFKYAFNQLYNMLFGATE